MSVLTLKHVNKYYKVAGNQPFQALKDVTVSFDKGELVAIIGESGSGKSTLMNLIGGLDSDFDGEILFNGQNLGTFKEADFVKYHKENVGFVFQSFNLISHLNLLDNVTMAMTLANTSKEERIKRAKEVLSDMGLSDHIYKKPDQISGGQKQRVAIARALVNDPDIIIADEPTGALDAETTEQVLEIITDIAKRGKLVVMVTHSAQVAGHCSRIVSIDNGSIVDDKRNSEPLIHEEVKSSHPAVGNKNLSFFSAIRLALLNMKEKLSRNLLVAVGSSIGIMSVILMLALGNGVKTYINDTMNSFVNPLVTEVRMPADTQGEEAGSDDQTSLEAMQRQQQMEMQSMLTADAPFQAENLDELAALPNVKSLEKGYSLLSFGANRVAYDENESMILTFATVSSNLNESNLTAGNWPEAGQIMLSQSVADELAEDSMIGRTVTLTLTLGEQVVSREFDVSGIFGSDSDAMSGMSAAYVTFEDLNDWYQAENMTLEPNVVFLLAETADDTESIKNKVKDMGYQGSAQEAMTNMFNEMLDVLTYVLAAVAGISLVVSAIMILVVLNISVVERTKEIGILKALGARKKDIRRIFVSEAFLIGLFSGVIGIAFAFGLGYGINQFSLNVFDVPIIQIANENIVMGLAISVVISMLASFLPSQRAAGLDPVESLRRE